MCWIKRILNLETSSENNKINKKIKFDSSSQGGIIIDKRSLLDSDSYKNLLKKSTEYSNKLTLN